MKLWVVFQFTGGYYDVRKEEWASGMGTQEFQGVFDSEEKAIAACRDSNYSIAPVTLNELLPHELVSIDGAYYPKGKQSNDGSGKSSE